MKLKLLPIGILILSVITLTAEMMSDNGRAGYTGSPGETTCNTSSCHNSFVLNSGGGSVSATSSMNNWTYDPLTNYTISIKVARTGNHLFGFGVELLNSTNNNAGTLTITDATHTQIKTRTVGGVLRRNIVHTLNGGSFQDSAIFTFRWTSPDTTAGLLTMYFAGNASNADANETGDYIYSGNQVITPASGNSIFNPVSTESFTLSPNPAKTFISLHYNLKSAENVEVKLYDLRGSLVSLLDKSNHPAGENNDIVYIPSECKTGLYLINIASPTANICRKLMIE